MYGKDMHDSGEKVLRFPSHVIAVQNRIEADGASYLHSDSPYLLNSASYSVLVDQVRGRRVG